MATDTLEWSLEPRSNVVGVLALYLPYAVFGGFGLVIVVAMGLLAVAGGVSGSDWLIVLVYALVGGPLSVVYLWVMVRYGTNASTWLDRYAATNRLSGRGLVLATVIGAVGILIGARFAPSQAIVAGLFGAALWGMVSFGLETEYELDRKRQQLRKRPYHDYATRFQGEPIELRDVTAIYRVPLGPYRLFWCRRAHDWPVFVPVLTRDADAVASALERARREQPVSEPRTPSTTPAMRVALIGVGMTSLLISGGIFALVGEGEAMAMGVYAFVYIGGFGVLLIGWALWEQRLAR